VSNLLIEKDENLLNLKHTTKIPNWSARGSKLERESYENHTRRWLKTWYFQVSKAEMNEATNGKIGELVDNNASNVNQIAF